MVLQAQNSEGVVEDVFLLKSCKNLCPVSLICFLYEPGLTSRKRKPGSRLRLAGSFEIFSVHCIWFYVAVYWGKAGGLFEEVWAL